MPKITRKNMKIFGSSAGAQQLGVFGSLAAGSTAYSTDPETIQSLSNYLTGWFGAILGNNSPAIQDMNSLCYLFAYQLSYLMQTGVPEWNASTTYYIGSAVSDSNGNTYLSLVDNNTNQALTDATKWVIVGWAEKFRTLTSGATLSVTTDSVVLCDATSGSFNVTLPAASGSNGKRFKIKRINTNINTVGIIPTGGDTIDGISVYTISNTFETVELVCNGSAWYII